MSLLHLFRRRGNLELVWGHGPFYGVSVIYSGPGRFGWDSRWPRWRIWLARHGFTFWRDDDQGLF